MVKGKWWSRVVTICLSSKWWPRCRYSFIYPRDIITPAIIFVVVVESFVRVRAHEDEDNVGDQFVKRIERTGNRAVYILITLPDIFNILRVWTWSLIGSICFPFWRSDYEYGYWVFGYFSRLRFRSASPTCVIILRNFHPPRFVTAPPRYPDRSRGSTWSIRDLERGYYPPTSVPTFQLFPLAKRFDYRWFAARRFSVLSTFALFDDLIFSFFPFFNVRAFLTVRDYYESTIFHESNNGFLFWNFV